MIQGLARQFRLCCLVVVIFITATSAQSLAAGSVDSTDQAGSAKKKLIAEYNHGDFKLAEASGRLALTQQPTDMEIRY